MKTVDHALAYAAAGYRVLPLRGKVPDGRLVAHGLHDASCDPDDVRRWWSIAPDAGIGIAVPPDVLVLDVDVRHDGDATLSELEQRHGELPETVEAETGGGGLHVWLRVDGGKNTTGELGAGLDTKTAGGYVVVPPSPHASGSLYRWRTSMGLLEHDIAAAPQWLLDMLAQTGRNGKGNGKGKAAPLVEDRIPDGKRRANLLSVAGTMRRRGLAEPEILAALREVNARRCDPPLEDAEVEGLAADVDERYEPVETIGRPTYTGPANAIDQTLETFEHWLHLPDLTPVLAVLGAVAANKLEGDPVWLGIVAPPSSAKTEILNALSMLPDIYPAATMSPASLLSGTSKKERAASSKGGLLREVGEFGILVLKDFGSILSMHRDARAETLAALRELYDGAWTRHVGSDGGQTLHWAGKLGLVFGATPALDAHHTASAALGERFLLCRMPDAAQVQLRRAFAHSGKQTKTMRHELAEAVAALFAGACPDPEPLSPSEMDELEDIVWLAVRLRSAVERDGRTREIEYIHGTEGPARLGLTLERLLAGLSSLGVDRPRAFDVVRRACMDSVPPLRRRAHAWLRDIGTPQSTTTVASAIGLPTNTTRRVLEDLAAYGLVKRESQGSGRADIWTATRDAA